MKGDFSKFEFYPDAAAATDKFNNDTGVLHQQGRALLDQDWNAADRIHRSLRQMQGRDVIGPHVAAIPAEQEDSFKVLNVSFSGDVINLELNPGRAWLDGLHLNLPGSVSYTREVGYFAAPVQHPQADPADIASGALIRDAVVLEVWEESFNAFQDPQHLLETALGGVDTTERVRLFHDLKLLRLDAEDTCRNLANKLSNDLDARGKLTVSPSDNLSITGPCPVELGGGYTGFEHYLYRIEIASPDDSGHARFKWSRFNGGLVGRGTYDNSDETITITANDQMINHCGLESFYLEALQEDSDGAGWRITFRADATLSADGTLSLTNIDGSWPGADEAFFRLWDGIRRIEQNLTGLAEPNELEEGLGILVEFEAPAADNTNYIPGDYWSFPVRAAGIEIDTSQWPTANVPHGMRVYRAPIAILNWPASPPATISAPQAIQDCRRVIQPLADLDNCCSVTVGDGVHSKGDFKTIQEAIDALPQRGGTVCVLSGIHSANVVIEQCKNVIIRGCGNDTKVVPALESADAPVFTILDSESVLLEHMDIAAPDRTAIEMEGSETGLLHNITVRENRILACDQAIHVERGVRITLERNKIRMLDKEEGDVGIYLQGEDSLIEHNEVLVMPAEDTPPVDNPGDGPDVDPNNPCLTLDTLLGQPILFLEYWNVLWNFMVIGLPENPYLTLGGIQIGGSSERIRIQRNFVKGGAGNGITLGSLVSLEDFLGGMTDNNEQPNYSVESTIGVLQGQVFDEDNVPLPDITLSFTAENGETLTGVSDEGGMFNVAAPEGKYSVIIATDGYQITNKDAYVFGSGSYYLFTLGEVEEQPGDDDPFGFIYDLDIIANEIQDMGLNGIGGPQLFNLLGNFGGSFQTTLYDHRLNTGSVAKGYAGLLILILSLFASMIIGLRIRRNHIHHCLNNPFTTEMRTQSAALGFGGISLGYCEHGQIRDNRIEDNGVSHIDPVCGIFARGSVIDIRENVILNNGPLNLNQNEMQPIAGTRGGIALLAFATPLSTYFGAVFGEKSGDRLTLGQESFPAVMLHGNQVLQPAGPALLMMSMGSSSVLDNSFTSEIAAFTTGAADFGKLGAVGIINYAIAGIGGGAWTPGAGKYMPMISGLRINNQYKKRDDGRLESTGLGVNRIQGSSSLLFESNLVRLGLAEECLFNLVINSNSDVALLSNTLVVERFDENLYTNAYLRALTGRATGNRLIEQSDMSAIGLFDELGLMQANRAMVMYHDSNDMMVDNSTAKAVESAVVMPRPLSLYTRTKLMNNTSHNQGDHCIVALPAPGAGYIPTVFEGNQSLAVKVCPYYEEKAGKIAEKDSQQAVLELLR
ncbi:MAG: DUF6519 domain-containing protein [Pseudomonadota bacterium]|nr:DUF6519 domain-containing protein [Pseudomonadota bacterium]